MFVKFLVIGLGKLCDYKFFVDFMKDLLVERSNCIIFRNFKQYQKIKVNKLVFKYIVI